MDKNFTFTINKANINTNLYSFYKKYKRNLRWREEHNPYCVMVSEFMLQQTQVNRVVPYFDSFISLFPTIEVLAMADQKEVLLAWSGLGYNRRALSLHNAAKIIVNQHAGIVPHNYGALLSIKGIGDYTSKAIVTYSYNIPHIFVETNIRSVFLILYRNFASQFDTIDDVQIKLFLEEVIDRDNPREWYYAMMDFGSYLKKKHNNKHIQKSKHFTCQSPFRNSFRQLRSTILAFLLKHQSVISVEELHILFLDDRFFNCLSSLENDGFIKINAKKMVTLL